MILDFVFIVDVNYFTGDLGFYNENGTVIIEDRLKELIKYKGYQVNFMLINSKLNYGIIGDFGKHTSSIWHYPISSCLFQTIFNDILIILY